MASIDLNADVGEGCAFDIELLSLVSSVSIACGAHAGDERTMRATIEAAAEREINIGAHPAYPDRESFGRRETGAAPREIAETVRAQLETFAAACTHTGTSFTYVKPHGALYNRAMHDPEAADSIARAVATFDSSLAVLGMPESALLAAAAAAGLRIAAEAFLDREYETPGALVSRTHARAVIEDPTVAAARAEQLALHGTVTTIDGERHPIRADSLCVHGDNPSAVAVVLAARARLEHAGVRIAPFCRR